MWRYIWVMSYNKITIVWWCIAASNCDRLKPCLFPALNAIDISNGKKATNGIKIAMSIIYFMIITYGNVLVVFPSHRRFFDIICCCTHAICLSMNINLFKPRHSTFKCVHSSLIIAARKIFSQVTFIPWQGPFCEYFIENRIKKSLP